MLINFLFVNKHFSSLILERLHKTKSTVSIIPQYCDDGDLKDMDNQDDAGGMRFASGQH